MSLGVGSIVSLGGGSSGGSGGGSGIQSVNGDVGPDIVLIGVSGIQVVPIGNGQILIGTSGNFLTSQSGVVGGSGIRVEQVDGNFVVSLSGVVTGGSDGSGINAINGQLGPNIDIIGVNGINVSVPSVNTILIDGAALSGISGGTASGVCYSSTFSNVTSTIFTHNLNTTEVVVSVYDENNVVILPDNIAIIDNNNVSLQFNRPQDGTIVILGCGSFVNVTTTQSGVIGVNGIDVHQIGNNFVVDSAALSGIIPQKFAGSFTGTSGLITHSLNSLDVLVQVYDRSSGGAQQVTPDSIVVENLNQISVTFNNPVNNYRVVVL